MCIHVFIYMYICIYKIVSSAVVIYLVLSSFQFSVIPFLCHSALRMRFTKELKECIAPDTLWKSVSIQVDWTWKIFPFSLSYGIFSIDTLHHIYVISFDRNPCVGSAALIITGRSYHRSIYCRRCGLHSAVGRIIDLLGSTWSFLGI